MIRPFLLLAAALVVAFSGCSDRGPQSHPGETSTEGGSAQLWSEQRDTMVRDQVEARGVNDPPVLAALRAVPRHLFVPEEVRSQAYRDSPLPIGYGQTISQPYVVAVMTEMLDLDGSERVLEVGTGSGYQAAVLAEIVDSVYTIEIIEPLARKARETLLVLGYDHVQVRVGDGYEGWVEAAPFDRIIVTCAPREIPPPLIEQLAEGGRMVIPCGDPGSQELMLVKKEGGGILTKSVLPVRFVPLTGAHGDR